MRPIQHVLTSLAPQLLMDIEASYYSIFKINKDDYTYQALCKTYPILEKATYIINPNFNNADGSIFIDSSGTIILEADFFANLITHSPLDFEYSLIKYTRNHPFEKIFSQSYI